MSALPVIACCKPLAAPVLSDDEAEATARLFKALGDPARVKILNLLATSDVPGLRLRPDPNRSASRSRPSATT